MPRAAGADAEDDIEEYPFGRFGWVADPEGNRLEPWEPPVWERGTGEAFSEQAILDAHRSIAEAQLAGDVDALDALVADDFWGMDIANGPFSKSNILEGHRSGAIRVDSHDVDGVAVYVTGALAVTTGEATVRGRADGAPFDHA